MAQPGRQFLHPPFMRCGHGTETFQSASPSRQARGMDAPIGLPNSAVLS